MKINSFVYIILNIAFFLFYLKHFYILLVGMNYCNTFYIAYNGHTVLIYWPNHEARLALSRFFSIELAIYKGILIYALVSHYSHVCNISFVIFNIYIFVFYVNVFNMSKRKNYLIESIKIKLRVAIYHQLKTV